jgi:hypothetical protein
MRHFSDCSERGNAAASLHLVPLRGEKGGDDRENDDQLDDMKPVGKQCGPHQIGQNKKKEEWAYHSGRERKENPATGLAQAKIFPFYQLPMRVLCGFGRFGTVNSNRVFEICHGLMLPATLF